jgi:hypothetical protein
VEIQDKSTENDSCDPQRKQNDPLTASRDRNARSKGKVQRRSTPQRLTVNYQFSRTMYLQFSIAFYEMCPLGAPNGNDSE